jgi:hypothetical protein
VCVWGGGGGLYYIWDEYLTCLLRAIVILFIYVHSLYFVTFLVFRMNTVE